MNYALCGVISEQAWSAMVSWERGMTPSKSALRKRGTAWPLGIPVQEVIEEELNRGPRGGLYLPADGKWRLRRGVTERICRRLHYDDAPEQRRRAQRMAYQDTDMDDPDILR